MQHPWAFLEGREWDVAQSLFSYSPALCTDCVIVWMEHNSGGRGGCSQLAATVVVKQN